VRAVTEATKATRAKKARATTNSMGQAKKSAKARVMPRATD